MVKRGTSPDQMRTAKVFSFVRRRVAPDWSAQGDARDTVQLERRSAEHVTGVRRVQERAVYVHALNQRDRVVEHVGRDDEGVGWQPGERRTEHRDLILPGRQRLGAGDRLRRAQQQRRVELVDVVAGNRAKSDHAVQRGEGQVGVGGCPAASRVAKGFQFGFQRRADVGDEGIDILQVAFELALAAALPITE